MRSHLREVENASSLLTEALEPSWVREFLDAQPDGPLGDFEGLRRALDDLGYRARQAQRCPDLATASGATRPGPGKARPEGLSPRTLCAIVISEAWKHVHGAYPSPKNRRAMDAAEAYWRAAGGEAHSCGDEPRPFGAITSKKPLVQRQRRFAPSSSTTLLSPARLE
jgi:hypothetical protein